MGAKTTSDDIIRGLATEFRVVTLGGVAVIATGLSRNTYDADIWVEPMATPGEWADCIGPLLYDKGNAEPVAMGSWTRIERPQLAEVIARDRVVRINGLERPLDIFREPNQLFVTDFDDVWRRSQPMDDGTRLPDPVDLLVSKQETGRDKDVADIVFLETKIQSDYLQRLPHASAEEAICMLGRFLTPRVAEAALTHPVAEVRDLGRKFLRELAEEGDPFAAEILRKI
jgi:hypothetical protein